MFKLFNSWGPGWGQHGYALIDYTRLLDRTVECYVCKKNIPDPVEATASRDFNLTQVPTNFIQKRFPPFSSLRFPNFTIKVLDIQYTTRKVNLVINDSATPVNRFVINVTSGDTAQIHLADTLLRIIPTISDLKKQKNMTLNIQVDSVGTDPGLKDIDSVLNEQYTWLKGRSDPSEEDTRMLNDYAFMNSGYKDKHLVLRETRRYRLVKSLLILSLFIVSVCSLLYFSWKLRQRNISRK